MNVPIGQQSINFPGYGMFWLANSITSTLMGFRNRSIQEQAAERNIEFQRELERARQISEDEKIQEEIAFKHRLMALSRQYRLEETSSAFINRMKNMQLQLFLQRDWPLDAQLPYILLNEIETSKNQLPQSLNVILLHSPLLPVGKYGQPNNDDALLYKNIEDTIMLDDIPCMGTGDIKFRKDACVKEDISGGNATIMNIHFLMSQFPTLVISPRLYKGVLSFNGAVWEPFAARPMIRPLFSVEYDPRMAVENENYLRKVIDLYRSSVSIIIGAVRDSYMLFTQAKEPTLDKWLNDGKHDNVKYIVKNTPQILDFVKHEKESLLTALEVDKTPKLLEVYSEEEIHSMIAMARSINI